jgi:hypothetical protein
MISSNIEAYIIYAYNFVIMEVWNFKYYKHKRERIKVSTKWNIDLLGSKNLY